MNGNRMVTDIVPLSIDICFVGIRYHRGHSFKYEVKLGENDNEHDFNAKVLVNKRNKWKYVAYVYKDDAYDIRQMCPKGFEKKRLKFLDRYVSAARYRIFIGV